MPTTLKTRFPVIEAELTPRVGAALKVVAEEIAAKAKATVPDAPPTGEGLVAAIHVEQEGIAEFAVVAGDSEVFYGHMVEHGTSHSAPRPFLVPALESSKDTAEAIVAAALREL